MRVLAHVSLNAMSGYGNDGLGITRALMELGHDVYVRPMNVTPPIPAEVAQLLTKVYVPPFDVAIISVDPTALAVDPDLRRASRRVAAWTMWHFDRYQPEGSEDFAEKVSGLDLMVVNDELSARALGRAAPDIPIRVHMGGFWASEWRESQDRDWSGTFRFSMVGMLHGRKNPFASIKAFQMLKERHGDDFDAELHLKTSYTGLHPAIATANPGIFIHHRYFSHAQMVAFYANTHCLLAPSRGEGKNIPALEAMSTGACVIATDVGGQHAWLRPDLNYTVRSELSETPEGLEAEVDVDRLAELMWHVYVHREEARRKGMMAARTIPAMFDWTNVMRRFLEMCSEVPERPLGKLLEPA